MNKKLFRYISPEEFEKVKSFTEHQETPFLLILPRRAGRKYKSLKTLLPMANIFYAVKANPHPAVIKTLDKLGSNFDVASVHEIKSLIELGISGSRMSYGNTIKKESDIAFAYSRGIRIFATDSLSDVEKLSRNAPGSKVFFRLLFEGDGAVWPLSKKFGSHPDTLYQLVIKAKELGLEPFGISFHVGSQQKDVGAWDHAISLCKYLFDTLKSENIELKAINLGGGLPTKYVGNVPSIKSYTTIITRLLTDTFAEGLPEVYIEPGRYMAGDCGVMVTKVALISKKSETAMHRWVYIDVGHFTGLAETEEIIFPIFADNPNDEAESEVILAGPTCDSSDIIYEKFKHKLPESLNEGDKIYILSTGAYTYAYSAIGFNGFPPLNVYVLE